MRYNPSPSVTADRTFSISTGLVASTVTPGRTPPDESRTTPTMLLCAKTVAGRNRRSADARRRRTSFGTPIGHLDLFCRRADCTLAGTPRLYHLRSEASSRGARQDNDGASDDFEGFGRLHVGGWFMAVHRRIDQHLPAGTESVRRHRERQRLMMRVEQQQEAVVANPPALVIDFAQRIAVEEHGKRLRVRLLPVVLGHLRPVRAEPGDVADALAAERPSLEPAAAPEHGM